MKMNKKHKHYNFSFQRNNPLSCLLVFANPRGAIGDTGAHKTE